jgi:predicted metalloprotease with PDZ domain
MIHRRRKGQPASIPTYISLLANYLGEESATKLYEDMSAGCLVIPSPESLVEHDFHLERADEDNWDLGFDELSNNGPERIVKCLKAGSHAENAGLRNGDRIMNTVRLPEVQEQSDAVMRLVVCRGREKEVEVKYRPRGTQKVEAYRYIDLKGQL